MGWDKSAYRSHNKLLAVGADMVLQVAAEVELEHSYGIELRDVPAEVLSQPQPACSK